MIMIFCFKMFDSQVKLLFFFVPSLNPLFILDFKYIPKRKLNKCMFAFDFNGYKYIACRLDVCFEVLSSAA